MPTSTPTPRPQAEQVVTPEQKTVKPNRTLESKLDRLMFGTLISKPNNQRFDLE
jgi:hypothetical protein